MAGAVHRTAPHAQNVEVLIKGAAALNITSMHQMASDYGITVNGNEIMLNKSLWTKDGSSYTYNDGSTDLTLEANIAVQLTTGG